MNYYQLDKEEQEILNALDKDELVSVATKEDLTRYASYASATLNRKKNINVRLSERDLHKLKMKAAEKGIPYQTLVASVLHQYSAR
jgi:predicted DNA binding CopG/RHH family protein